MNGPRTARTVTWSALASLGLLHVAWARGSSAPFGNRGEAADAVVGTREFPGPAACYAVAIALGASAALVAGMPAGMPKVRRAGVCVVAGAFTIRGAVGLVGRTAMLSPASVSPRFRRLDRRVYSPVCLALAAGALSSLA